MHWVYFMLATSGRNTIAYPEIDINFSDLNSVNAKSINNTIELFHYQHILIVRNQHLNEDQLINVSKIFGEPAQALVPTFRLKNYPVITCHTNTKDENHIPKGVIAPEYVFHADSYFAPNPTKVTLFYCLKAPNIGGETHFINMCAVYESLDQSTKDLIADKRVSYKNAFINQPPVTHPLVRIHPITGEKALNVNKHRALGIAGLEQDEATRIVEDLYHYATSSEFVYKHKWRSSDLLIWNNVTTMHSATPIPDSEERLLYRILTKGDLPVT